MHTDEYSIKYEIFVNMIDNCLLILVYLNNKHYVKKSRIITKNNSLVRVRIRQSISFMSTPDCLKRAQCAFHILHGKTYHGADNSLFTAQTFHFAKQNFTCKNKLIGKLPSRLVKTHSVIEAYCL